MNLYVEIQKELGNKDATHYNRVKPRWRQGATREKKGTGYRPRGVRAGHDSPGALATRG